MTSGATCEQCSEDDETTTNGLPSKYRQYVTLSGIDFRPGPIYVHHSNEVHGSHEPIIV